METFPDSFKIAKILGLHKEGSWDIPNNYRPISLLTSFSKIFEKLLYKRMMSFATKFKIISTKQFGFQKNHSCVHAITKITEYIRKSIERKQYGFAIFVDLKKAFDTVNHDILFEKLCLLGFRGKFGNLLKNYFQNRRQFVQNGLEISSLKNITCGVPQGSVLGPLLFLLYINDITDHLDYSEITLFADDTTMIVSESSTSIQLNLQKELSKVDDWCKSNKLTINTGKSKLMCFGKNFSNQNTFYIGENNLTYTSSFKYLGVTIDNKLKFSQHIDLICLKMAKFNGILYRARNYFSKNALILFYKSYIVPVISYGLMVYGCSSKQNLMKILVAQKKLLRTIAFKRKFEYISHIFEEHNIETVHDMFLRQLVSETVLQFHGTSPLKFLEKHNVKAKRMTRFSSKGLVNSFFTKSCITEKSIEDKIVKCFNFLQKK